MNNEITIYREKAKESLLGAQSELVNRRFNNCASRSYYACFQAAMYALLTHNLVKVQEKWQHSFVKGQFVLQLINRRKQYHERFRSTLERCYDRRQMLTITAFMSLKPRLVAVYQPLPILFMN